MKSFPIYKVRSKYSQTFGNPLGQTLHVNAGDIGTFQLRRLPFIYTPESDPKNWVIDVNFNGQKITIAAKSPIVNGDLKPLFITTFDFLPTPIDKNSTMLKSQISSYTGEQVLSSKQEALKNAFGVIGLIFFLILAYWYVTGGPFKSIQ